MTTDIERRSAEVEIRTRGRVLEGYAARFGVVAQIADFREQISPQAFTATLADGHDILGLVDHARDKLLGRTRNRSLKLATDANGLHFEITLPSTTLAADILALAEARSLGGASFAFRALKESWTGNLRTLEAVTLHEISVVQSHPAYPQTSVSARSHGVVLDTPHALRLKLLELE